MREKDLGTAGLSKRAPGLRWALLGARCCGRGALLSQDGAQDKAPAVTELLLLPWPSQGCQGPGGRPHSRPPQQDYGGLILP